MAPTPNALRKLLKICEQFSIDFDLEFNASKSECIVFRKSYTIEYPEIKFNDMTLKWKNKIEYLGHIIKFNLDDTDDLKYRKGKLYCDFNDLLSTFHFINIDIFLKLFKSYCCSFFGSVTYNYCDVNFSILGNPFKICLRKIWKVPFNTHSNIILELSNSLSFEDICYKRYKKLSDILQTSENKLIVHLHNIAMYYPALTITAQNNFKSKLRKDYNRVDDDVLYRVASIRELSSLSFSEVDGSSLTDDERTALIAHFCLY